MPFEPEDEFSHTIISFGDGQETAGDNPVGDYLVAVEGQEPGRIIEIPDEPLTIGRDPKQPVVFADTELSRLHARISLVGGKVFAEDLRSTNGTFVDGQRITRPTLLREGSLVRLGRQLLKYERRSKRDVGRTRELGRDLQKAGEYVLALLPPPMSTGPVRTAWKYVPSTQLGGDAFGYYWLDADTFVFYLIDVSGHGVRSAMHSVTALNVLRQRALPQVDFTDPAAVLRSLNERFQMDTHDGMYFTMWYGVYRVPTRVLRYSSAGHHPAYLFSGGVSEATALGAPAFMIGMLPDVSYEVQETLVPAGSAVCVFSDGVYEIVTADEKFWELSDVVRLLSELNDSGEGAPEKLYATMKSVTRGGTFADDFTLLRVAFP